MGDSDDWKRKPVYECFSRADSLFALGMTRDGLIAKRREYVTTLVRFAAVRKGLKNILDRDFADDKYTCEIDVENDKKYGLGVTWNGRVPATWPANTFAEDVLSEFDVDATSAVTMQDQLRYFQELQGWDAPDITEKILRRASGALCQLVYMGVTASELKGVPPAIVVKVLSTVISEGNDVAKKRGFPDASHLRPSTFMRGSDDTHVWQPDMDWVREVIKSFNEEVVDLVELEGHTIKRSKRARIQSTNSGEGNSSAASRTACRTTGHTSNALAGINFL